MAKESGITFSILNYNGGNVLNECLRAVYVEVDKLRKRDIPVEVQLVDNGSTDFSHEAAYLNYGIDSLIEADNKYGFITGVNESFERAKHGLVFFLSYDVILKSFELKNNFHFHFHKRIIQPLIYDMGWRVQNAGQSFVWPGYAVTSKTIKNFKEIPYFSTTAFLMSRESFREIGEFDEDFAPAYYENIDYSIRAKKLGYKFYSTAEIRCFHYTSLAFSKRYSKSKISKFYQINQRKLIRKHYHGLDKWLRLAVTALFNVLFEPVRVIRNWRSA